jgi:hypothetical protein
VSTNNDPRKDERYKTTIAVMEPEIQKLKALMAIVTSVGHVQVARRPEEHEGLLEQ